MSSFVFRLRRSRFYEGIPLVSCLKGQDCMKGHPWFPIQEIRIAWSIPLVSGSRDQDCLMDGRMDDLRFYSLSTILQSYQDDEQWIMKDCVPWNPVYRRDILPRAGLETGTARSVGPLLTH